MRPTVTLLTFLIVISGVARAQAPPPPPIWDVQVAASYLGTGGNSETSSMGADFLLHRRWPVWQIESAASAVRSSDNDVTKVERYLGGARGQRKLWSIVALSSGWRGERDPFAGMDFRSLLDAGLGWALVRAPRWTLDGTTALAWSHERPTLGSRRNDPVALLEAVSRVPFGATSQTVQRFTFYPNLQRGSAYRSEAELSAQAAMNSRLALKLGYLFRRSNEPVPGFKKNDTTATASIVLSWRATTTVQ
jgi:putative salt-induced outer membrane protein